MRILHSLGSQTAHQLFCSENKIVQTDTSFLKPMHAACQTSNIVSTQDECELDSQSVETQTEIDSLGYEVSGEDASPARSIDECFSLYKQLVSHSFYVSLEMGRFFAC